MQLLICWYHAGGLQNCLTGGIRSSCSIWLPIGEKNDLYFLLPKSHLLYIDSKMQWTTDWVYRAIGLPERCWHITVSCPRTFARRCSIRKHCIFFFFYSCLSMVFLMVKYIPSWGCLLVDCLSFCLMCWSFQQGESTCMSLIFIYFAFSLWNCNSS